MPRNKDVFWLRADVLKNQVSFYVETWENHASKHASDKVPSSPEHIYQTVVAPDVAHRSLDPVIGGEVCLFVKRFEIEQLRFIVPVIYDGVEEAGDYDQGGKKGRVQSGWFLQNNKPSNMVGEIIWTKQDGLLGGKNK